MLLTFSLLLVLGAFTQMTAGGHLDRRWDHAHHVMHRKHEFVRRDDGGSFTGPGTFFYAGLGACGTMNGNNDMIIAMNSGQFSQGVCFQWVSITYNGQTIAAQITDSCPTCAPFGIDLSLGLMEAFVGQNNAFSVGQISLSWSFSNGAPPASIPAIVYPSPGSESAAASPSSAPPTYHAVDQLPTSSAESFVSSTNIPSSNVLVTITTTNAYGSTTLVQSSRSLLSALSSQTDIPGASLSAHTGTANGPLADNLADLSHAILYLGHGMAQVIVSSKS